MFRYLLLTVIALVPLAAQTSSLQGTVSDAQGGAIPDAVITLLNEETSAARKTLANPAGGYSFLQMSPGAYRLEVSSPGFRVFTAQVRLQVNSPATLNVEMELGQVTETVSVMAEALAINTQNATVGNPFTETQVRQLPLQTRNVVELLALQPGVTSTGQVIGAKADQNNVTLDGVDVNDSQGVNGFDAVLPIPLDSVQEFRTTVAGQGADQGRSAGGQVSIVTKSGTNSFHGSVYEFHRNVKTAANNWFSNRAGIPRENLIRNQYGASFGGPIVKNRAFFFANWEDRKDRSAAAQSRVVPTQSYRDGVIQLRTSDGIQTLTAPEIRQIDPLLGGANPFMLDQMKQYPLPNDLLSGGDRGLNFATFRFNAPLKRDDRAYVAKTDFSLDGAGLHTLSVRGTLADNVRDNTSNLAQFPGQDAASKYYEGHRGISARYTAVLKPTVINVFSYGLTRLGVQQSGVGGASVSFVPATLTAFPRAITRIQPTHNIVNDTTWTKGAHTVQFGANLRLVTNDRMQDNNYPSYAFSRNTLKGLGADINALATDFLRARTGNSALRLTEGTFVTNAFGTMFGILNNYSATYQYGVDGSAIPFGQPVVRSFGNKEYEFYIQDAWKVRPDLNITAGLRYGMYQVPFERNGVQVATTTGIDQYFAQRIAISQAGIPGNAMTDSFLTFALAGPTRDGQGYYRRDNNNFAPRLSIAWAPVSDSLWGRLFGKGAVIRAGGAMVYDRYGSAMATSFAESGSPGLATRVTQPSNTDFTDSFRYSGGALPGLPAAPQGGFPFTPPAVAGGFGSYSAVNPNLVAPYSMLLNFSYTRPLPGQMTMELGYIGRLSRKGILRQDYFQPLTQFRDSKSGMTWTQASGILRDYFESGITPAQVRANPAILPKVDFFENLFPTAGGTVTGTKTASASATSNYFYTVYGTYAGSDLDALHDFDRVRQPNGTCFSAFGCNTFFAMQNAGMLTWVNASNPAFHGGQLVLRRPVSRGWGFDFNYTFSKSMDIASGSESGGTSTIQDAFNPGASRSLSDFDIRHNITANSVAELPFGRGKHFLRNAPGWLNHMVGGWQVSMLTRFRSGLPLTISTGGVYPTNYLSSSLAILRPGSALPETKMGFNEFGVPSVFASTTASNAFYGQYPGTVGARNLIRGPRSLNFDLSLGKYFQLPLEGHRIQVRAEAFNAFNTVNWNNPSSLTLSNPTLFGQITGAADARVMQFALRYEF
ncbi:MAG: carboxypeptidase-like regulatory domain-containing protein [Bryobacteraceae bacterium]